MNAEYLKIEKLVRETYMINDPGIIKLLCAVIISYRLDGPPAWIFIVAPPSGGKTILLEALANIQNLHPLSSLTANTFVSGMKKHDQETSLLHIIKSGILSFKDFTTIISLNQDERREIISQLREIYDGSYNKRYGTGHTVSWEGKITLIAGVTEAIYAVRDLFATMGERNLMYSLILPDRYEVAYRALGDENTNHKAALKKVFADYLNGLIQNMPEVAPLTNEFRKEIALLSEFATRARSPVDRDMRSREKEITYVHTPEQPPRFAKQLKIIAQSLMIINEKSELEQVDRDIIYKLAFDSISATRRIVLKELAKYKEVDTASLATKINYPTNTVRHMLEDLNALKICERSKTGKADKWGIYEQYRGLVAQFEGITPEARDLDNEAEQYDNLIARANQTELPPLPEAPANIEIDPSTLFPEAPTA